VNLLLALALIAQQQCRRLPDGSQVCSAAPMQRIAYRPTQAVQPVSFARLISVEIFAERGGIRGLGSGTIVKANAGHALVLTVAHELRAGPNARYTVRTYDGSRYQGIYQGRSAYGDLGALLIATPASVSQRISSQFPTFSQGAMWRLDFAAQPASQVIMMGWGGENDNPNLRRTIDRKRGNLVETGIVINGHAGYASYGMQPELGDSGGGAWSPHGEFVGVLSHRDGDHSSTSRVGIVVGPSIVNDFLAQECCLLRPLGRLLFGPGQNQQPNVAVNVNSPPASTQVIPAPEPVQPDPAQPPVVTAMGPQGPAGPPGPQGPPGRDGASVSVATPVPVATAPAGTSTHSTTIPGGTHTSTITPGPSTSAPSPAPAVAPTITAPTPAPPAAQPPVGPTSSVSPTGATAPTVSQIITALQAQVKPITFTVVAPDGTTTNQAVNPIATSQGGNVVINLKETNPTLTTPAPTGTR
jgi:hypothetical protein